MHRAAKFPLSPGETLARFRSALVRNHGFRTALQRLVHGAEAF
jgi:hypothetical protein